MTKTVVILGAGIGGVPLAQYLLSHTTKTVPDLRVILVSPNDEFFWNVAAVRAVIPGQLTEDKYLFSIPKLFAEYSSDKFEFIPGKAEVLSPDTNSIVVALNDGSKRSISYHTVVVATGSDAKDGMPWKPVGTSQQTRGALEKLKEDITKAKTIVVGGAGMTGVEFAGELGSEYAKHGKKQVTIIAAGSLPLEPPMMPSTRETAKKELEKMKIKVIGNTKVTSITDSKDGGKVLELTGTDGSKTTLKADLFVPTFGTVVNTQFVPQNMLDESGRVKTDSYLRSSKYKNVFVIGDASNLQPAQAVHIGPQVSHLAKHFGSYLTSGTLAEYKFEDKVMAGITIGRDRGTGQMGTWKLLSLMIWWVKGRYLGTNYSLDWAKGLKVEAK